MDAAVDCVCARVQPRFPRADKLAPRVEDGTARQRDPSGLRVHRAAVDQWHLTIERPGARRLAKHTLVDKPAVARAVKRQV